MRLHSYSVIVIPQGGGVLCNNGASYVVVRLQQYVFLAHGLLLGKVGQESER